jgi:RHS repeat-associated protein
VSKTVAGTHTGYVFDGQNFVLDLSNTPPKANLITGVGLDEVFLRSQSGTSSHHLPDALGSILGITDGNGALATSYAYEPYGAVSQAGAANENSQQYTGRENDGTELMYYRARYYDPLRMRFVSEDPIGFSDGMNLYEYVEGNPITWVDPEGLQRGRGGAPQPGSHYNPLPPPDGRPPRIAENNDGATGAARAFSEMPTDAPSAGGWPGINTPWSMPRMRSYCKRCSPVGSPLAAGPAGGVGLPPVCRADDPTPNGHYIGPPGSNPPCRCIEWGIVFH